MLNFKFIYCSTKYIPGRWNMKIWWFMGDNYIRHHSILMTGRRFQDYLWMLVISNLFLFYKFILYPLCTYDTMLGELAQGEGNIPRSLFHIGTASDKYMYKEHLDTLKLNISPIHSKLDSPTNNDNKGPVAIPAPTTHKRKSDRNIGSTKW